MNSSFVVTRSSDRVTFSLACVLHDMRYNVNDMGIALKTILVLLQLLICTVGQGALTLCVRRDGTQHLEWTWASECQSIKSASHTACGHESCTEGELAISAGATFHCDPCTDYVLIAEPMVVTASKPLLSTDEGRTLCWYMPITMEGCLFHHTSRMAHPPPSLWDESSTSRTSHVVLRC